MSILKGKMAFFDFKLEGGKVIAENPDKWAELFAGSWAYVDLATRPKDRSHISVVRSSAVLPEDLAAPFVSDGWKGMVLFDILEQTKRPNSAVVNARLKVALKNQILMMRKQFENWKPDPEYKANLKEQIVEEELVKTAPTVKRYPVCVFPKEGRVLLASRSDAAVEALKSVLLSSLVEADFENVPPTLRHVLAGEWSETTNLPFTMSGSDAVTALEPREHISHWLTALVVDALVHDQSRWGFTIGDWIKVRFSSGRCRQATIRGGQQDEPGPISADANPVAAFAASSIRQGAIVEEVCLWWKTKDQKSLIHTRVDSAGYLSDVETNLSPSDRTASPDLNMTIALKGCDHLADSAKAFTAARGGINPWAKLMASLQGSLSEFSTPVFPLDGDYVLETEETEG